jgi:hypothetical protein
MTDRRSPGIAALLVAAGMTLGGCTTAAQGAAPVPAEEPAAVHEGQDGGPGVVTPRRGRGAAPGDQDHPGRRG